MTRRVHIISGECDTSETQRGKTTVWVEVCRCMGGAAVEDMGQLCVFKITGIDALHRGR